MKKSFFAVFAAVFAAALGLLVPQAAQADGSTIGFYVQGDLGLTSLRAKTELKDLNSTGDWKATYKESTVLPRVSVGHDFGDWRVAGDYTHYKHVEASSGSSKSKTRAYGAGVSVIYDVPVYLGGMQPYVGARVSVNNIRQEVSAPNSVAKENDTKLSPGVMGGVGFHVARNMVVDAGYRYNHLDTKLKAHELTVGLRYTFR
ncbi:opacity family porin [Conchiformibius steedae]|uniref:opacity family porin n=1 Tax=Conchiformibius steedae TaxID=153493 RepID=UPI0026EF0689|nr:opacity family porin [Conchiformibius steedae]